jgi:hypothetical protein
MNEFTLETFESIKNKNLDSKYGDFLYINHMNHVRCSFCKKLAEIRYNGKLITIRCLHCKSILRTDYDTGIKSLNRKLNVTQQIFLVTPTQNDLEAIQDFVIYQIKTNTDMNYIELLEMVHNVFFNIEIDADLLKNIEELYNKHHSH